jgi:hypothetical protein
MLKQKKCYLQFYENQLKTMEEDMMYKAESDSTVIYKEIKKAIFDLKIYSSF